MYEDTCGIPSPYSTYLFYFLFLPLDSSAFLSSSAFLASASALAFASANSFSLALAVSSAFFCSALKFSFSASSLSLAALKGKLYTADKAKRVGLIDGIGSLDYAKSRYHQLILLFILYRDWET